MKTNSILFLASLLILLSCAKDKVADKNNPNCIETVSFSTEIMPMVQTYCISCHDVGNGTGITLTNHTNIASNADAMMGSIQGNGYMMMPQGGASLSDSLIQKVECWIYQGKLDN